MGFLHDHRDERVRDGRQDARHARVPQVSDVRVPPEVALAAARVPYRVDDGPYDGRGPEQRG